MKFKIYMAGFQEMCCDHSPPHLEGEAEGDTFEQACQSFFTRNEEDKQYYDPVSNVYWSLKLAPTMADVCDDYELPEGMTWRKAIAISIKHNVLTHLRYTEEAQKGLLQHAETIESTPVGTIYHGHNKLWSVRTVNLKGLSY